MSIKNKRENQCETRVHELNKVSERGNQDPTKVERNNEIASGGATTGEGKWRDRRHCCTRFRSFHIHMDERNHLKQSFHEEVHVAIPSTYQLIHFRLPYRIIKIKHGQLHDCALQIEISRSAKFCLE